MRYLGLDLGTKTLGVSISDKLGLIANGYKNLTYSCEEELLIKLKEIIDAEKVDQIVLGFPKNMNNTIGERANKTLEFKEKLESLFNVEVFLEDERWTTVQVNNILIEADVSRKKRKKVVDKLAATVILQSFLDKKNRKGE